MKKIIIIVAVVILSACSKDEIQTPDNCFVIEWKKVVINQETGQPTYYFLLNGSDYAVSEKDFIDYEINNTYCKPN